MKKPTLYLGILLFLIQLSVAQAQVELNNIQSSYLQSDLDYPAIINEDFRPVKNNLINEGMHNGQYWIKLQVDKRDHPLIVELPYARLTNISIHSELSKAKLLTNTHYPTISILPDQEQLYFIQVTAYRPAYIPITIRDEIDHGRYTSSKLLTNGLYYGFSICIILINLLFLGYFKDNTFLRYSAFVVVICLNLTVEDGLFQLLGVNRGLFSLLDSILHWLVPVSCAIFTWYYVDFRTFLPRIKWPLGATIIISALLYIAFHITGSPLFSGWADTTAVMALFIVEIGAWMIFKKNIYAKIFTFAYLFILICALDLYVPKHFGLTFIGLGPEMLKMGGVLEMVIFSVAIVYRMNTLREENELHKREIRKVLDQYDTISSRLIDAEKTVSVPSSPNLKPPKAAKDDIDYTSLTARQMDILNGIRRGLSNQEIADELFISLNTVKYHTKNIYEKLGIQRRTQLIAAG